MGKAGSKWRHGWVPLNAAAAKLKRGGKSGGSKIGGKSAKTLGGRAKLSRKPASGGSRRATAPNKAGSLIKSVPGLSNVNHSKMTNADKIKAAAMMFGTGSKQHRAAAKKFR